MSGQAPTDWTKKLWQALLLLVAVAIAGRVIFDLLEPLIAPIIALLVAAAIVWFVIRRR